MVDKFRQNVVDNNATDHASNDSKSNARSERKRATRVAFDEGT